MTAGSASASAPLRSPSRERMTGDGKAQRGFPSLETGATLTGSQAETHHGARQVKLLFLKTFSDFPSMQVKETGNSGSKERGKPSPRLSRRPSKWVT